MKIFKQMAFLLFAAALPAHGLFAQEVVDSLLLPEVVVTERYGDRRIRSTAPVQTLSGEQIQHLNALQLSDAVKYFSGVTIKDYGGIGGLKSISVRSLGANHTGLNYNGIAVSDVQTGQIDIGRFSLDNVENITLYNGQSDQIFLPARAFASASALSITTEEPHFDKAEKFNGNVSIKAGSFGLLNPAFTTNIKLSDKLSANFSGEWMSAHGKYPYTLYYGEAGVDSSSVEKRENSDVKNLRLETALSANFAPATKGDIRLYYYQSERGLPGATIYYNTKNFSTQRLWDRTFFIQGHFEHSFSRKWLLQANAKYNRGYLRYLDPTYLGVDGKIEDIFTQNEIYGSISVLYRASERISFSLASDITTATLFSNREAFATPKRLTSQSVLAAKWVNDLLLVTASLLYTHTFESVRKGVAAENRSKLSPHLSTSCKPFEEVDFRLRAFYKNSFRLPTFNDLYYPLVGLRNLQPEDAHQFNLGATYSVTVKEYLPLMILSVDAYHNRVKDKIVAYPTGNLYQWTMMNIGIVNIHGIDVSAEGKLALTKKMNLLFGFAYTYQKAVDKTDAEKSTYNHQIPYTPRHSGSIRTVIETNGFNIAYNLLWSGERFSNGYNSKEFRMAGYADHSVSVSKSRDCSFGIINLSVEALNLTDKNYEIVRNYPMPGRSFRAKIRLTY